MVWSLEEIARASRIAKEYLGEISIKEPPQTELWDEIQSEILAKYDEQLEQLGINLLDWELSNQVCHLFRGCHHPNAATGKIWF